MESCVADETPTPAEPETNIRVRKPRIPQVAAASEVAEQPAKKVRVRKPLAKPEAKTEAQPPPPLPVVDAPFLGALCGTLRSLQKTIVKPSIQVFVLRAREGKNCPKVQDMRQH